MKIRQVLIVVAIALSAAASLAVAQVEEGTAFRAKPPDGTPPPKPDPRPDPWGCRRACGTKACCVAMEPNIPWDSPIVKAGLIPPRTFPYVPIRDPRCWRLDLISIRPDLAAINVNGYTLGHISRPRLSLVDGGTAVFDSGQLAFTPPSGVVDKPLQCPTNPNVKGFVVDTESNSIVLNDVKIVSFDSFQLTKELVLIKQNNINTKRLPLETILDLSDAGGGVRLSK